MQKTHMIIGLALAVGACVPLHGHRRAPAELTSVAPALPDDFPWMETETLFQRANAHMSQAPRGLADLAEAMKTLATAFAASKNEAYADRAASLLKSAFVDPKSRIGPRVQPTRDHARQIIAVLDAIHYLRPSAKVSGGLEEGLRDWQSRYLSWLTQGEAARKAQGLRGSAGTWFDLLVARVARFVGAKELAVRSLEKIADERLGIQIEPDGRQPMELGRSRPFHSSHMNLCAYFLAARLGESLGVDVWHAGTFDGRDLRGAYAWLKPYGVIGEAWPYRESLTKAQRQQRLDELARLASGRIKGIEPFGAGKAPKPEETLFPCR